MRNVLKAAVVAVLLLAGSAHPAQAAGLEGLLDYIDHLSGPGPFIGAGIDATLWCDTDWVAPLRPAAERVRGRSTTGNRAGRVMVLRPAQRQSGVPPGASRTTSVNARTVGAHGTYWLHARSASWRATAVRFSGELVDNGSLWSSNFSLGRCAFRWDRLPSTSRHSRSSPRPVRGGAVRRCLPNSSRTRSSSHFASACASDRPDDNPSSSDFQKSGCMCLPSRNALNQNPNSQVGPMDRSLRSN